MYLLIALKSLIVINIIRVNLCCVLAGHHLERISIVTGAPIDRNKARGFKLKNGMKVVLINDPLTEQSAASMVVGVGALNDPQKIPGLTNLVGHVLLESGGKNSQSSNFIRFIESRGGTLEAPVTAEADQSFSFRVHHSHFVDALSEFAQLFVEPRLSYETNPNLIRKPLQSLQRQFLNNQRDDDARVVEVLKSISRKKHCYNHLYCGNIDLLYQHVRNSKERKSKREENELLLEKVKSFHRTWYSSNLMTLAVFGKRSLDELEEMVLSLFENVNNREMKKIVYPFSYHPWAQEQLGHRICVAPLDEDLQILALVFPLPDFRDSYAAAVRIEIAVYAAVCRMLLRLDIEYVGHYLTHAGHDTLVSELQNRTFCTSLKFTYWASAGFAFVKIVFKLTDYGILHTDRIINLTFQYIYMLEENGVEDWMFEELRKSIRRAFLYNNVLPISDHLNYVAKLARRMQNDRSIEFVLVEEFFRNQWNPAVIREFLSFLRPRNMNITVVSKFCKASMNLQKETHHGTLYRIVKIDEELLRKWETKESIPPLHLPKPSDLVPEDYHNFPRDPDEPWEPYIIHESSISEIWFKQEAYAVPEISIDLEIISSFVNLSPLTHVLWRVYHILLEYFLNDYVHTPQFGGSKWMTYNIKLIDRGMLVTLSGANDKVPLLLEKVLSRMNNLGTYVSEQFFTIALKKYALFMRGESTENHFFQSNWSTLQYSKYGDDEWEIDSVYAVATRLQYADMKQFLRKVFRRIFIRCLIYGNYSKQKALDSIVKILERPFHSSCGLLLKEKLRPRLISHDDKSHYFYRASNKQPNLYGSAYFFVLESDSSSPLSAILSLLLHLIIKDSCQKFLTVETGHRSPKIECLIFQLYPELGFIIKVVSEKDPRNTDLKLEKFVASIPNIVMDLKDSEFISFKKELENYIEPSSLNDRCYKYWFEIYNRSYNFGRSAMQISVLQILEKSDLLTYFKENLHQLAPRRRKFTLHILPEEMKQKKSTLVAQIPSGATKIEDMFSYKTNATLLPYEF